MIEAEDKKNAIGVIRVITIQTNLSFFNASLDEMISKIVKRKNTNWINSPLNIK